MQHGALTPLGRQLRAVLANLFTSPTPRLNRSPPTPRVNVVQHGVRPFSSALAPASQATAAIDPSESQGTHAYQRFEPPRTHSHKRRKRQRAVPNDYLTDALNDQGNRGAAAKHRPSKINLSHVNPRSAHLWRDYDGRRQRFLNALPLNREHSQPLSLQRVTARYSRCNAVSTPSDGEQQTTFELTAEEQEYLQHRRYSLDDVAAWARIISAKDALGAAESLSSQLEASGPRMVPVWVLLYTLRREYVSARALRILVKCTRTIIDHRMVNMPDDFTQVVFIAIVRLVRHARKVWPQAMRTMVGIMLHHLTSREHAEGTFGNSDLANITQILNKLMSLVSLSTTEHPFKNNHHQEAAVVPVLQYMAERNPSLHINRQGYRAVVRIQLRLRKTDQEREWAELKSLSWPPWKVDRTAMDTALGPEHGISRAGATLARMREAGYRPLHWEKLAELFSGWDVDKTPTIQMRTLLSSPGMMLSAKIQSTNEPWSARILSTRTVQEAWACYLAWEDLKLPPDQSVYLATFTKLHEEQRRQRRSAVDEQEESADTGRYWPLLAGDIREVWPLPPSTHLETYTRTAPPTVAEFYRTLHDAGVALEGHCLAFAVEHATTFAEGLERLRDACSRCPEIESFISLSPSDDIHKVQPVIYAAAVKLCARFPQASFSKLQSCVPPEESPDFQITSLYGHRVNCDNPVVHALRLLHIRPATDDQLWSDVLYQFTFNRNLWALGKTLEPESSSSKLEHRSNDQRSSDQSFRNLDTNLQRCKGAMNALRLTQCLTDLQQQNHIDIDSAGFQALCRLVDHAVVAWWSTLQRARGSEVMLDDRFKLLLDEAGKLALESRVYSEWLRRKFGIWIGQEGEEPNSPACETGAQDTGDVDKMGQAQVDSLEVFPKLLTIPDPATLHTYIRALGWLSDYKGMHATVLWMRKFRLELLGRSERDRRGAHMMKKTLVALRVFLERSWIDDATPTLDADDIGQFEYSEDEDRTPASLLARARRPADSEIINAVREIVEDVQEWGGWPSDEDVRAYINNKTFSNLVGQASTTTVA